MITRCESIKTEYLGGTINSPRIDPSPRRRPRGFVCDKSWTHLVGVVVVLGIAFEILDLCIRYNL